MVKYNKIDDGAKEAVLRVLKKKGGNKELTGEEKQNEEPVSEPNPEQIELNEEKVEEIDKEEDEEMKDIINSKLTTLIKTLVSMDNEADSFEGSVDDYLNSRLTILTNPQYNEEGEKEGSLVGSSKKSKKKETFQGITLPVDTRILEIYASHYNIHLYDKNKKISFDNLNLLLDYMTKELEKLREKYTDPISRKLIIQSFQLPHLRSVSPEGAVDRESMLKYMMTNKIIDVQRTVFDKNEAGYCNEYLFEKYIIGNPISMMPLDRFLNTGAFFNKSDFTVNGRQVEVKTAFQEDYDNPVFWVPKKKITDILQDQSYLYVYWTVSKTPKTFAQMAYDSVKNDNSDEYVKNTYYLKINRKMVSAIEPYNLPESKNQWGQLTYKFNTNDDPLGVIEMLEKKYGHTITNLATGQPFKPIIKKKNITV